MILIIYEVFVLGNFQSQRGELINNLMELYTNMNVRFSRFVRNNSQLIKDDYLLCYSTIQLMLQLLLNQIQWDTRYVPSFHCC